MKFDELDTDTLYRTGNADREVDDRAAMVVDAQGRWTLVTHRRQPDEVRDLDAVRRYSPRAQRRVPVVALYGRADDDAAKLRRELFKAARVVRPLLVDCAEETAVNHALTDAGCRARFRMTTPSTLTTTWEGYLSDVAERAERDAEHARRRQAEYERQLAAHDAVADVVQAGLGDEPGSTYGSTYDWAGDNARRFSGMTSSPRQYADGSTSRDDVRMNWTDLAAVVAEAQRRALAGDLVPGVTAAETSTSVCETTTWEGQ